MGTAGTRLGPCACGGNSDYGSEKGDVAATVCSDGAFREIGTQTMQCKIIMSDEEEDEKNKAREAARLAAEEIADIKKKSEALEEERKVGEAKKLEELEAAKKKKAAQTKKFAEAKAAENAKKALAERVAGEVRGLNSAKIKEAFKKSVAELDVQKNVWASLALFKGKEYKEGMDRHYGRLKDYIERGKDEPESQAKSLGLMLRYCQENREDLGEPMVKEAQGAVDSTQSPSLDPIAMQLDLIAAGKNPTQEDPDFTELKKMATAKLLGEVRSLFGKEEEIEAEAPRKFGEGRRGSKGSLGEERTRQLSAGKQRSESKESVPGEGRRGSKDSTDAKENVPNGGPTGSVDERRTSKGSTNGERRASKGSTSSTVSVKQSLQVCIDKDVKDARSKMKEELQCAQNIWGSMALMKGKPWKQQADEVGHRLQGFMELDETKPEGDTTALVKIRDCCSAEGELFNPSVLKVVQGAIDAVALGEKRKALMKVLVAGEKEEAQMAKDVIADCKLNSPALDAAILELLSSEST